MNEKQKSTFIAWLNDAHALEMGLVRTLEKQITETKDIPTLSKKLEEHLEETKTHAKKVESILERYDTNHSTTKDVLSQVSAAVGGVTASLPSDALVKNLHTSYAAEHMEIATYTLIGAVAKEFDDTETATICKEILADEEDMAAFLLEQLPQVGVEHIKEK